MQKPIILHTLGVLCCIGTFTCSATAQELHASANITLPATVIASEDVSGIARLGSSLLVVSDEASEHNENVLQVLNAKHELTATIPLLTGDEVDLEGLAVEGRTVYAIGSHSSKRKRIKADKSYRKNLKSYRDDAIKDEAGRDFVFRVRFDKHGAVVNTAQISLHDVIQNSPVLTTFSRIPSKENGVDIEGLAVRDGWLYAGFRGPVFRGNRVPVLRFNFDHPTQDAQLLFVTLGGRGIRGITEVSDGFLLLAGPVGDGDGSYRIYHWDGNDTTPGKKRHGMPWGQVQLLGELVVPVGQKAEGVTLMQESPQTYQLLIAYDNAKQRDRIVQRFDVRR
ncbi:MAG: DUF3616 domain-containing protein [Mariprofundaceae bacterium]|nr:DUF3616 domain-containing protein [Mariprofundaceae bacterium]